MAAHARMMRLPLMAALLAFTAAPAAAQFNAQASRDSAVLRVLSGFSEPQLIRVALLRSRWAGRFLGVNGDTLFLGTRGAPPMGLRFNAIDTVWSATRATGRGVRIGAVAGAIVGAAVMGVTSSNGTARGNTVKSVAVGTAAGVVAGAAAGALVGSMLRRWARLYP